MTRAAVSGLAAACLVTLVACSGGSPGRAGPASTIGPTATLAQSKGFRCVDPRGDLGTSVKGVGTGTSPAGIDILVADAEVQGKVLAVTFEMAGDPASAPAPLVDLLQGDVSAPDYSFELRASPSGGSRPGSPWGLTLITFKGSEQRRSLNVAVTVTANSVSYQVPLADLPPIATLQWTFGSSSTAPDGTVVFDDCSSLTSPGGPATAPAGSGPTKAPIHG